MTLLPRFQGHGVIFRSMNALHVLCVQRTRDLFAIAKFLSTSSSSLYVVLHYGSDGFINKIKSQR